MIERSYFGGGRALPEPPPGYDAVDDVLFCRGWCVAAEDALASRISALHVAANRMRGARGYIDEALAGFESVKAALHELHLVAMHPSVQPWLVMRSPLIAYLSAAYVWCGDVLGDLRELATQDADSPQCPPRPRDSQAKYVAEFLHPLSRRVNELCGATASNHPLQRIRLSAERVQAEIVALSWELGA